MLVCPIHTDTGTDSHLIEVLRRIDDPELLVTLAVDFARHVAHFCPNWYLTDSWLNKAQNWKTDFGGARQAAEWAAGTGGVASVDSAQLAIAATIRATEAAVAETLLERQDRTCKAAVMAVQAVALSGQSADAEALWQDKHMSQLTCTCHRLFESPLRDRLRNSLLT